jgi:3-(3-hydroxy-phenyl)propionate hydroxylase
VGDAAHIVSPFGARPNGGIQDVDNLIWKLELVMAHRP